MNQEMQAPAERAVALPSRVGQGTAVEQARAMAEVHAAMLIAREMPRDVVAAMREMEQSCTQFALADRAQYRYSRGGASVNGPSVHLARELARCWGNIQYGIIELRRDDDYGQSEMQAWAWDVQTNVRSSSNFIVPHKRDTKEGAKVLVDMRDIYENNANNGARRLRESVFSVLPVWFKERAIELCAKTLREGGGVPLPTRVADAIKAYENRGISKERLERKVGKASNDWNEFDVADLRVMFQSLQRGEITIADEFPQERVTAAEVLAGQTQQASAAATAEPDAEAATTQPPDDAASASTPDEEVPVAPPEEAKAADKTRMVNRGQLNFLFGLFGELGVTDDQERLQVTADLIGRTPMHKGEPSWNGLTADEALQLRNAVTRCKTRDELEALIEMAVQEREAGEQDA